MLLLQQRNAYGVGDRKECIFLNPFTVRKIINESKKKGERLIIEELSERCGVRLRHRFLVMSDQMFECQSCVGFPRHWVKGVSLNGWVSLWRYEPPKETDFSPVAAGEMLKSFDEMREIEDVKRIAEEPEVKEN